MSKPRPRKDRLERLLHLVRLYRGWSGRQLASALERDPHNLVPSGGVPRLDLILRLSEALDWPVESVVRDVCGQDESLDPRREDSSLAASAAALARLAWERLASRDWEAATEFARRVREADPSPEDISYSYLVEFKALEFRGRYSEAISAAQSGLRVAPIDGSAALWLRGYLASGYLALGNLQEAIGVAAALLDDLNDRSDVSDDARVRGLALSVRGHSRRILAPTAGTQSSRLASRAIADLEAAIDHLHGASRSNVLNADIVGAAICKGGLIELRALRGEIDAAQAIQQVLNFIDEPAPRPDLSQDWAEAVGWWCIFGCNVVTRALLGSDQAERWLAILSNKADECATITENWALREKVWTLEHLRRRELEGFAETDAPWALDREDLATLTGVMGRFPVFREVGWKVLAATRLPETEGG